MTSAHAHTAVLQSLSRDLFPDERVQMKSDVGHYHSGVNTHGLIRGYGDAGQPICLPVIGMNKGIPELVRRVSDRCKILLDSGAFGAFTAAVRELDPTGQVPHFESEQWRTQALHKATLDFSEVAAAYRFIAEDHPENVTVVLPDVVGFQAESLVLLEQYRQHFAWTEHSAVTALLPIQRGPLSPAEYHATAVQRLGFIPDGWGFPSREAAMSIPEIVEGVRNAIDCGIRRIHFLGAGRESRRFGEILAALNAVPGADTLDLTTDANTTRAYVGQGRPQTERRYAVLAAAPDAWLKQEHGLDVESYVSIRWSAFLDGEDPALLKAFHRGLRDKGLAPKAKASFYSADDMTDYVTPLIDPETGEIYERIDALGRRIIEAEFRALFDGFASAAAAFDFFSGYSQPGRLMVAPAQSGDFLHRDLGCGRPARRAPACETEA